VIVLGINAYHPDASAALVEDGRVLWAGEEERFSRLKHTAGFPALAVEHALKETGILPSRVNTVALSRNPRVHLGRKALWLLSHRVNPAWLGQRLRVAAGAFRARKTLMDRLGGLSAFSKARFVRVEHHLAHLASSFFVSGMKNAACLSIDGLGDFSSAAWGAGAGDGIRIFGRIFFPHSVGFLYTAATQFLGFPRFGDEYKVMGLAPYGRPAYLEVLRRMVLPCRDGEFRLDLTCFTHHLGQGRVRWDEGAPEQDALFSGRWTDYFGPPRLPGAPLTDRDRDLAASVQAVLEERVFDLIGRLHRRTKLGGLCLAGGVAQNSVMNGKIFRQTPFRSVYVPPAASDAGTAVGAALWACRRRRSHRLGGFVLDRADLGSAFGREEIVGALDGAGLSHTELPEPELIKKTAAHLASGRIVGWFQGKMEFGPRALGSRSILADPRQAAMKDALNSRVKNREAFRPFAPSVPEERAGEFFETDGAPSPFMSKVFSVRPAYRGRLPAVTHAGGTSRVQTVSRETLPLFWRLLTAFGELAGIPVLLNTSFNENEPMVRTPEEAVRCFMRTRMDVLVMGNVLSEKTGEGPPD